MNQLILECLEVEFSIIREDQHNGTMLVRWYAKFEIFSDGKEYARIMNKETSDFCGTRGEAEGRQAELDRKFKGKKFEIYKENCIWKCRLPKKLKNKKQKQLF